MYSSHSQLHPTIDYWTPQRQNLFLLLRAMAPGGGRGRGRPPGRQNRANGNKSENQRCFQFQKGKCKFGKSCKFSHDTSDKTKERPSRAADTHLSAEAREEYYDWKRLLRASPYESHGSERVEDTLKFWEGALGILDGGSQDQHHMVAKELVQDNLNGPAWIEVTTKMASFTTPPSCKSAEAFLRVIAHPSLTPLSISPFVGTIYVLFGGTNGEQGIEFLFRMCTSISKTIGGTTGTLDPDLRELVDVILKALQELLVKTSRTRFCDGIPKLIEVLDNILAVMAQHVVGAYLDGLRGRLDIIKRIVEASAARMVTAKPSTSDEKRNKNSVASSFPREVAIPGGRHDNDFAEISEVSILPTQGEITSAHEEYLPSTNFLHPHVLDDPMQRYIDSTFRLVRHDTLGPINDVLRDVLSSDNLAVSRTTDKNSQAQVYTSAKFRRVSIHERHGLEAIVSFLAPPFIRKKSPADQRDWWQRSPRLGEGTLVCFVTSEGEHKKILFLQVTTKTTQWNQQNPDTTKSSLVAHNIAPSVTVKLAKHQQNDLNILLRLFQNNTTGILVDFNGVIPDTFMPILKNLQKIKAENHIAFQQWILPTSRKNNCMPPPLYARKPGFVFPLNCIAKNKDVPLNLDPTLALKDIDLKKIEDATGLDHGQCLGMVGALTREYALIQGPPGTGKSYLGVQLVRTLLAVKKSAKLGPILIICYTNHALDQFLKHLLDVGITAIIRIGGRSTTEELDSKNIRVVSKETQKTGVERSILGESYSAHESSLESADQALRPLFQSRKGPSWDGLKRYLARKHPQIYRQFEKHDEDGFEIVTKDILKTWLGKRPKQITVEPSTWRNIIHRAEVNRNVLSPEERWFIVEYWLEQQHQAQIGRLFESLDEAEQKRKTIQRTHDAVDQRTLARADVIGITTTSLAKQIGMLRSLKIKCVMCEEAGELREADIISALMESVEHFIQIGDHKQLRPQINNFELSLESSSGKFWQLDRSQFERRAIGEPGLDPAPFAQLNVQRRMRPEISQLIRRVYPNLQDHESVFHLDDVVGMRKNLFWLDHNHPEDSGGDGTRVKSHSNTWETNMATALVRHIVRQGEYKPEDVALLTPYTGQLQQLRAALGKDFEICLSDRDMDQLAHDGFENDSGGINGQGSSGAQKMIEKKQLLQTIRLATVDNFQGEEAKVIIVSLVRSNTQRKVGFLRTENRINVLLSRAQHGMYLIGNSETYLNRPMWADVYNQLSQAGSVGNEIELCCPRHKDIKIICTEPEDFPIKSPEGGCTLPCSRRLEPCGHQCPARCHSNAMHEAFFCQQPCPRVRQTCDHPCAKLCGELCGPCRVQIHDIELPCGHVKQSLMCHKKLNLSSVKCTAKFEKVVPTCGHTVTVECWIDVKSHVLEHAAAVERRTGLSLISHAPKCAIAPSVLATTDAARCAMMVVPVVAVTNHVRSGALTPLVPRRVTRHALLVSKNVLGPVHIKRLARCLVQHHATDFLATNDVRRSSPVGTNAQAFAEKIAPMSTVKNAATKVTPELISWMVLGCGHFFTGETLDGLVGLDEVYSRNKDGAFDGLKDTYGSLSRKVPFCPDCKRPIRQFATKRYNRLINRAVMDEICKRFIINGREALSALEAQLRSEETHLSETRTSHSTIASWPLQLLTNKRYHKLNKVKDASLALARKMGSDHQPTKILMDRIATARLQVDDPLHAMAFQFESLLLSRPEPDRQIILGANLLAVKAEEVQLQDSIALLQTCRGKVTPTAIQGWLKELPLLSTVNFFTLCHNLILEAKKANLPRIIASASLCYAKVSQLATWRAQNKDESTDSASGESVKKYVDRAKKFLQEALLHCKKLGDSEELKKCLEEMSRIFEPQYNHVTPEELASIKSAMVSGHGGLATHSGHWYNCVNGHPFAIGECGMPMELAQCPECGAPIGGQSHQAVAGVSRAREME
ncbi:NFX1-type zinc finger-containing protein [Fusarium beomiforme]|uniref:NFX1-type zinc finger-containing protein n=1 Tax=Fusarium beomiforme TaxID=44412 RepID=A0A9P5AS09_9HYPO|nr:NFX1-type zinc finger-containing protein [Fusarium beomiforme]